MAGTNISQRLTNKIKDNVAQEKIIKLRDNKILELNDKISALQTENGILEREVNEWNRKQREGYCWYTIKPDTLLITNMGEVLPYSNFTYPRLIPATIDTNEYRNNPYYEIDSNGKLGINTTQAMKYKTGGLL